jgi:hypothetical protein
MDVFVGNAIDYIEFQTDIPIRVRGVWRLTLALRLVSLAMCLATWVAGVRFTVEPHAGEAEAGS